MAIKVSGTSVINDSRQLQNIASLDSTTISTINSNISTGGITALGSANIVGTANSVSISNLNLSSYKQLLVIGRFITVSGGGWMGLQSGDNANGMIQTLYGGQNDVGTSFSIMCDLATGVAVSSVSKAEKYQNGAYTNIGVSIGLERGGGMLKPGITTSTTTVSLHPRAGSYTFAYSSGNVGVPRAMYLYGVA